MQCGNVSHEWSWFKSDNDQFIAYSEKMRHLRIITHKDCFNEDYAFCSKNDLCEFISFMKEFIIVPHIADIEYITSHKISKNKPVYKVITRYYQPETHRVVFEKETHIDVNVYTKSSEIESKNLDININTRKQIINSFSELEKIMFYSLLDDIQEKLVKENNWS